jgi:hypothetical protein
MIFIKNRAKFFKGREGGRKKVKNGKVSYERLLLFLSYFLAHLSA